MKPYHFDDFCEDDAWLMCRVDTQIQDQPVDVYMVMNLPSGMILALDTIATELSEAEAKKLLQEANTKTGKFPRRILLAKGDPAELPLKKSAESVGIQFEAVANAYLEKLTAPLKESFGQSFFSPSSLGYVNVTGNSDELAQESIKKMVPDSYDLCSCASGKKYKFCCKKIFCEIMEAMTAAENGHFAEALEWIEKAKAIAGETSEVIYREAVVYSFFDNKKSDQLLDKCLSLNANHPRAYYTRGIGLQEQGDHQGAVAAYETAIRNYPASDHFRLNEAYNNLGTAFYALGDVAQAKAAWEKAVLYFPEDKMARENLADFIYKRIIDGSDVPSNDYC